MVAEATAGLRSPHPISYWNSEVGAGREQRTVEQMEIPPERRQEMGGVWRPGTGAAQAEASNWFSGLGLAGMRPS